MNASSSAGFRKNLRNELLVAALFILCFGLPKNQDETNQMSLFHTLVKHTGGLII